MWKVGMVVAVVNSLTNEPSAFGTITSVHEAAPLTLGASWIDVHLDHAEAGVTHRRSWDGYAHSDRGPNRNKCRPATPEDLARREQLAREASLINRVKHEIHVKRVARAKAVLRATNFNNVTDDVAVAVYDALMEALDATGQ